MRCEPPCREYRRKKEPSEKFESHGGGVSGVGIIWLSPNNNVSHGLTAGAHHTSTHHTKMLRHIYMSNLELLAHLARLWEDRRDVAIHVMYL